MTPLGLAATAMTSFDEPFALARRFMSLDYLSDGRAARNLVTSSFDGNALNFRSRTGSRGAPMTAFL